jgi:hypothetical protein
MTLSPAVDQAILLAEANGNAVVEMSTGWTNVREVVYMRDPLSAPLRLALLGIPGLREWVARATPHNRAEVGFIDDLEEVSIAFPAGTLDGIS